MSDSAIRYAALPMQIACQAVNCCADTQQARAKSSMTNTLARLRMGVFRQAYDMEPVYPIDSLIERGII